MSFDPSCVKEAPGELAGGATREGAQPASHEPRELI